MRGEGSEVERMEPSHEGKKVNRTPTRGKDKMEYKMDQLINMMIEVKEDLKLMQQG